MYFHVYSIYILGIAPAGGRTQLQCSDFIQGRYVTIYLNHTSVLNMCEIQVFGSKYNIVLLLHLQKALPLSNYCIQNLKNYIYILQYQNLHLEYMKEWTFRQIPGHASYIENTFRLFLPLAFYFIFIFLIFFICHNKKMSRHRYVSTYIFNKN